MFRRGMRLMVLVLVAGVFVGAGVRRISSGEGVRVRLGQKVKGNVMNMKNEQAHQQDPRNQSRTIEGHCGDCPVEICHFIRDWISAFFRAGRFVKSPG